MPNELFWLLCLLQEESSRKRRLPVVSSVVKVKKFCNDGEDEEEEEDYGSRTGSISSSVSVPAKPERRYLRPQWFCVVSRMNLMNKNFGSESWGKLFAALKIDRQSSVSCFCIFCTISQLWE